LGAGRVIGTVGSESKISAAREAGADHVICYEKDDFVKEVNELTNGLGADVILDSIGGSMTEKSLHCLAMYGRLVNYGDASGGGGQLNTKDLYPSCRSVLGFSFGTTRNKRPHLLRDTADRVFGYLSEGRLKMKIGKRFSLEEAAEAHRWVESRQSTGKVILNIHQ
jgi:NADPH2:quinone reductase